MADNDGNFGPGQLRQHSLADMGRAIATALSTLTGERLHVRIDSIAFSGAMDSQASLEITVTSDGLVDALEDHDQSTPEQS